MLAWDDNDLRSAVCDLVTDDTRCPGCGLTEDEGHFVEAELGRCPTCEDLARQMKKIPEHSREGWRGRFDVITDPLTAAVFSSRARFTAAGMDRRRQLLPEWRARGGDG